MKANEMAVMPAKMPNATTEREQRSVANERDEHRGAH